MRERIARSRAGSCATERRVSCLPKEQPCNFIDGVPNDRFRVPSRSIRKKLCGQVVSQGGLGKPNFVRKTGPNLLPRELIHLVTGF